MKLILRRLLVIGFILMATHFTYSQSFIQTSSVSNNKYTINPAYAGMTGTSELNAIYRSQWQGVPGNPQDILVNIHSPVYPIRGAVGLQVRSDRIGNRSVVDASGSYNYVLETNDLLVSLGSSINYMRASFDATNVTTPDGEYIGSFVFENDDPIIRDFSEGSLGIFPGLFVAYNSFEIGLSYEKYFGSDNQYLIAPEGTFHAFAEYIFSLPNGIEIETFAHVKNQAQKTQADFYLSGYYNQRIMLGAGLRGYNSSSLDAVVLNVGFRLTKELSMAYYYDVGISSLSQNLDGSHEILLKYRFANNIFDTKRVKRIYNSRFVDE